jgi:hypothetical protein
VAARLSHHGQADGHRDGDADVVALKCGSTGTTLWTTAYPDVFGYQGETDLGDDWAVDIALGGPAAYVAGRQVMDHTGVVDADFLALAIER